MNSYSGAALLPSKGPYGLHLVEQYETLNYVYRMISTMRFILKNTLQTFQKGILMSIRSLQLLFQDLQKKTTEFGTSLPTG